MSQWPQQEMQKMQVGEETTAFVTQWKHRVAFALMLVVGFVSALHIATEMNPSQRDPSANSVSCPDGSIGELCGDDSTDNFYASTDTDEEADITAHLKDSSGKGTIENGRTDGRIKRVSLIGERHSGTTWMEAHLDECFGEQLQVTPYLTRWKHFFQYEDPDIIEESGPTLVIAQFRDIYDFVDGMVRTPHHAHDHLDLDWKTFVTKPWTMPRGPNDTKVVDKTEPICQRGFRFDEVVPCTKADKKLVPRKWGLPVYELRHDGSGLPYDSIVDLRSDKVRNFLDVANYEGVDYFFVERYENLVANGTSHLLRKIEAATGIKAACEPSPPRELHHHEVEPAFVRWMNKHVDWEAERLIGYEKRKVPAGP